MDYVSEKEKVVAIHDKVSKIVEVSKISGEPLKEYRNKSNQYSDMLKSIDSMKALTTDEKTIENLENQQLSIIKTWMEFELNFANRLV